MVVQEGKLFFVMEDIVDKSDLPNTAACTDTIDRWAVRNGSETLSYEKRGRSGFKDPSLDYLSKEIDRKYCGYRGIIQRSLDKAKPKQTPRQYRHI